MFRIALPLLLALALAAHADGPMDNVAEKIRPVPPLGVKIADSARAELTTGLKDLAAAIDKAGEMNKAKPAMLALLPDVQVYHKAVLYALENDEVYIDGKSKRDDLTVARRLLNTGLERAKLLEEGKPIWTTATGLVVRGYRSKIDDSVQPYGLVIPASYANSGRNHRCDFWWAGRGETRTELDFIQGRERNAGEFTPADTIVVHPYGRFCNANKFAGEIDTLEVLDHVKKHYRIDENRLVARGFSMGGAACWQFAVHYPSLWCAAAPGAGFAETPEFLNVFQKEKVEPTWYERRLWKLYNCTESVGNLTGLPTVAYSGEIDPQKQAADVMARELKKIGRELTHIIGPKTGHKYEPGAKVIVNAKIDALAAKGKQSVPAVVIFETYSLRYNKSSWVEILGMEKHWRKARVVAVVAPSGQVSLETENVTALRLNFNTGEFPAGSYNLSAKPATLLERFAEEDKPIVGSDQSFRVELGTLGDGLRKSPGLQGPIDDAFLDRFIIVKPTGTAMNKAIGDWTEAEMTRAIRHWRKHFRGDAIVKLDTEVTADDIASANLILWGDPKSNALLAKIADKLPLKEFNDTTVTALIYPNPLNPKKYVVLNSGFTFRDYDYLNNARQVPKLPDYALIDVTAPPNGRAPGKIIRAGFFGEKWELLGNDGK